jgi:predicted dehydrogenase
MLPIQLLTYDPGHFHAALVQKEMLPGVDNRVHIYAPLGPDLIEHLARLSGFNNREDRPTSWQLEVHAGPDALQRMLAEKPGNVVILSGRNRRKIDVILASLQAGLHVLADKPWVIDANDLPKLDQALQVAQQQRLVASDIMTERYEITARLQRSLVADRDLFGEIDPGTPERPGVSLESVHYIIKQVAGVPLRRPAWFFNAEEQGEGLADVGTHLADLVPWIVFPEQIISTSEIEVVRGSRSTTAIGKADYQRVTGQAEFPSEATVVSGQLLHPCNNTVLYRLRGVWVWLNASWGVEALPGRGDRQSGQIRGTRCIIEERQGEAERFIPEIYLWPRGHDLSLAVQRWQQRAQEEFPGVRVEAIRGGYRLEIPDELRTGHETHFTAVTRRFLSWVQNPASMPAWESANMKAKYFVTTHGVRLARAAN